MKILPFPSLISQILEEQLDKDFSSAQRSNSPELFKITVSSHELREYGSASDGANANRVFLVAQAGIVKAQIFAVKSFLSALQRQETLLEAQIAGKDGIESSGEEEEEMGEEEDSAADSEDAAEPESDSD